VRIAKFIALPAIALAATAGTLVAVSGSASAAVVSGATTLSVPLSFVASAAESCVTAIPQGSATAKFNATTKNVDFTFPVTGGNANLSVLNGFLDHSGSLLFIDACTGKTATINSLVLDVSNTVVDATPQGGSSIVLFDLEPNLTFNDTGTVGTFDADSFAVDPAGASYLDSALGTTFFTAFQGVGPYASTWNHN
jgi:hypothetical protein